MSREWTRSGRAAVSDDHRNKRPVLAGWVLFAWLFSGLTLLGQTLPEKDLPANYQEWLKIASYIILPVERDVFLKLTTDRERDAFIDYFWKQRDPTPGTPQNEFREEHIKRFNTANSVYGRGTTRAGWLTDMGRMSIILGQPRSVERIEGTAGIHPCQVWYYYGDPAKGLPAAFALVFYQRSGSGEFKLYNPVADGPLSLLVDSAGIDISDYEAAYRRIKELAPTLANAAISLIPGQYPSHFMPSPQTNIILANIMDSPKKNINPAYATHFLSFKGLVSTEYLTNYIDSVATVAVIKDPLLGIHFCHFALSPKKISLDYFQPKDQYFCGVKMDVSLRHSAKIISQYSKDFPLYFAPDKVPGIQAHGLAFEDSFPVIEGRYGLTVLLQNSVGKEFTIMEREIVVGATDSSPQFIGPVLGYDLASLPSATHTPFKFGDQQLQVDPNATFSAGDRLAFFFNVVNLSQDVWRGGEVAVLICGLREKDPVRKSLSLKLKDQPYGRTLGLSHSFRAAELAPDYYDLLLILKNERGEAIAETKSQFIVSPQRELPHPVTVARSFPLANAYLFYSALGSQYDLIGATDRAQENFEKALLLNPEDKDGRVRYANFLLRTGKHDLALEVIAGVRGEDKLRFDYFLVRGRALAGKGDYAAAIEDLLEANRIYDSDTRLLNSLGFCYYRTGQRKAASDVLKASLRLNPQQPEVRELLSRVEKELEN
jgi:GWxTD domain-containing protein